MFDPQELLGPVIQAAEKQSRREDGDYVGDDGLLYCGRCRTAKQTKIQLADWEGNSGERIVPCICECQQAKFAEAERRRVEAEEMERMRSLRRHSLMDARLEAARFDAFTQRADNEKVLKTTRFYAEHFDLMLERNQGLLFWGAPGTGKTFAAACIANHLIDRGVSVLMTSFVKILGTIGYGSDAEQLIERISRVKLLVIDDLGAERSTDTALEKVYNIIDSRYRAKLPIILTTNNQMADMKLEDNIQYSRIYDRIFEMCYPVEFKGRSWRKAAARNQFYELEKLMEETE